MPGPVILSRDSSVRPERQVVELAQEMIYTAVMDGNAASPLRRDRYGLFTGVFKEFLHFFTGGSGKIACGGVNARENTETAAGTRQMILLARPAESAAFGECNPAPPLRQLI